MPYLFFLYIYISDLCKLQVQAVVKGVVPVTETEQKYLMTGNGGVGSQKEMKILKRL